MKLDMDLIRTLLLKLEVLPIPVGAIVHITPDIQEISVDGKTPDEMEFHLELLCDAGFIDQGDGAGPMVGILFRKLTWAGDDFLDSVRDPAIWHETKEGAKKAGGFTVDLLVALAKGLIRKKLQQHSGVDIDL
jgi:hypothetical protein